MKLYKSFYLYSHQKVLTLTGLTVISCFVFGASVAESPAAVNRLSDAISVYQKRQTLATPQTVLAWLKEGNSRFLLGKATHGGYLRNAKERLLVAAQSQRPLAAVLSCIDSRTTPELVFDTSIGDLFTARVGANVVNDDILGSLEIAVESGAKVIVVLGHTECGGVKAACTGLELGHMTQLLQRVKPAISVTHARLDADAALSQRIGERIVSNRLYVAEISHANAQLSADHLLAKSPLLKEKILRGEILLVPALYDVDSGLVTFDAPK